MPATGDRITKRKDGLFQGMYTAHTPDGPRRKYIYGRRKKDVERRLAEAMGDAARGSYSTPRASRSANGSTRGFPTTSSRLSAPARWRTARTSGTPGSYAST
jgi:hypothetical protein